MIINGKIIDILTQKENDWGRYKILCDDQTERLAVGVIKNASLGMELSIDGNDETNQYGRQFKVAKVISAKADNLAGARRFFTEAVKGLGEKKAGLMVGTFGSKVFNMLETEEGRSELCTIKGIGPAVIKKVYDSYQTVKKYKEIYVFLNGIGTKNQINKIYEKYNDDNDPDSVVKVIKKNPYRLIFDVDGFGFMRVDALAVASGVKPDSIFRIMAAAKYAIDEAQTNGHCYLPVDELKQKAIDVLAPIPKFTDISETVARNTLKASDWMTTKEKLIKAHNPSADTISKLSDLFETRKILNDRFSEALLQAVNDKVLYNDDGDIYSPAMYYCETELSKLAMQMVKSHPVQYVDKSLIEDTIKNFEEEKTKANFAAGKHERFVLGKEQRDAIYKGLMSKLAIISGGPGRGKTTIIELIVKIFCLAKKSKDVDNILLLAPTGRAAQRIEEQTGFPASTAHRTMYKVSRKTDKNGNISFKFALRPENERPKGKLIICDETSMLDVKLAKDLLEYASDCNLILVGDADQIPSVGPGKVLRDMIASNVVPYILLKEGHRNQGSIAYNADLINNGQKISTYCYDDNFVYVPTTSKDIANDILKDFEAKVAQYGIKNVMLCTPMRSRGEACVDKLNKLIQAKTITKTYPFAKVSTDKTFYIGDRVMQTKNNYEMILHKDGAEDREGVFNGERGTIIDIRTSMVDDFETLVVKVKFDDDYIGEYTNANLSELVMAYATTLHKCQGSEAACTMIAMTYGDYILANKELFYTGVTRAKKECRLYGEEQERYGRMLSAFDIAVKKTDNVVRYTKLAERLIDQKDA